MVTIRATKTKYRSPEQLDQFSYNSESKTKALINGNPAKLDRGVCVIHLKAVNFTNYIINLEQTVVEKCPASFSSGCLILPFCVLFCTDRSHF